MSGGSYDYAYGRLHDLADALRSRHRDRPHVAAFAAHLDEMARIAKAIEWADSGDTGWDDALDETIRGVVPAGLELSHATEAAYRARADLEAALARVAK